MTDSRLPARPISSEERQATIDRLCAHYAGDTLEEADFERRLDLAYTAKTSADLVAIERDLPELSAPAAAVAVPPSSVPAPQPAAAVPVDPSRRVAARDFMVSIWGATDRKGSWTPARTITSLSIMGGAGLDFRDATFGTDEVNVRVVAVMGGAEIIVPPGVRVEWNGVAIMGGVDIGEPVEPPGPDAPVIRVTGLVCMGSVEVVERERGETAKEARKRRRALRKARRRLAAESQD